MSPDKMQLTPNHPALRTQRARVVPIEQYASERADAWTHFGELLRAERLTRGITRERVLEALDLHPVHHDYVLKAIETGTHELDVTWARQIQDTLGMPVVHLMAQAGVATRAQLAVTGDDMPLAGRPVAPPTAVRRTASDVRAEAAAVLGLIAGAVFVVVGLMVTIADGGLRAAALVALCGVAAIGCLSWPAALITGRVIAARNRLG